MQLFISTFLFLLVLSSTALSSPQEGTVEGMLVPPDAPAQVSASRKGSPVATVHAGDQEGRFRLRLPAGTYTITISAPVSSFPVRLENVVVKPGEATVLPSVLIMPGSGKAVLSGKVIPPRSDSEVKLLYEGNEHAVRRIDQDGRYEFRDLPAGRYEVRATAPGHAQDVSSVTIPENQRVQQTAVLFPVVAVDGVDWATGKIRAAGVGSRPANATNAGSSRAMAQRAAVADAQRNLLRTIEQIRIDGGRNVGTLMADRKVSERIQGFVKGYTKVSERELGDGRIEVILELPLTGPSGLSRYITE